MAASIALARKGLACVVVDGGVPPLDKCCGEGLLPDSLTALQCLEVGLPADSAPIRGIRFLSDNLRAEAPFSHGVGRGVRRTLLQEALLARAHQCGVSTLWGEPAVCVDNNTVLAGEQVIRAHWIVGCDGAQSGIRAWASLESGAQSRPRFGFRRHFARSPWTDFVEVYWSPGTQAYVTPVSQQEVGVAVLTSDPHQRVTDAVARFPELEDRLHGCALSSSERGAVTLNRSLADVCRGNVALVGDASGSVDAVTGMGLGLAFRQALALADAVAADNLDEYRLRHRRIQRRALTMARLLLLMDRWPWLAYRVVGTLARNPRLFSTLLSFHTTEPNPHALF